MHQVTNVLMQDVSNIIENRYHMKEDDAANSAAYLLAGPVVLYPLVSCQYLLLTFGPYLYEVFPRTSKY